MKQGKSLVELATEIDRQAKAKIDYVVGTPTLSVTADLPNAAKLQIEGHGEFGIRPLAHEQIAGRLKVPKVYYDRLLAEEPGEWSRHITERFHNVNERRLVRTLDGDARSFNSDRFHRRDNDQLARALMPVMLETPGLSVVSAEITERRLYIKVVSDRLKGDVRVGEPVRAGAILSNSEVGCGSTSQMMFAEILRCLNGMVIPDFSIKKYHVGRHIEEDGVMESLYQETTLRLDDAAFWAKMKDVLRSILNDVATFDRALAAMRAAAGERIKGDPIKSVEILSNKLGLSEGEQGGILRLLMMSGDLTKWGLSNAVTALAGSDEVGSYDRATELEALGGRVITLPESEWSVISKAA
jgi:hypothetical protein